MADLTVRFPADKPELVVALSEVLRAEADVLERDDAVDVVRQELGVIAPGVSLSGGGMEWRLDGEAPAYRLRTESPEEAGLPPTTRR